MFRFIKFLMLTITISLISCDSKRQEEKQPEVFLEDFDLFYDKFHSDSLFQLSRIKFPLEGKYRDGQEEKYWSKENWTMLKIKISDVDTSQFKTSIVKTDSTFIQKCYLENSGFSSEYKFKLIKKKWFLIYAKDINL